MIQMGSGKAYLREESVYSNYKTDTNIFVVGFQDIEEEQNSRIQSGDPVCCQNCSGILNNKIGNYSQLIWNCEFCDQINEIQIEQDEIPQTENALYLINPNLEQITQNNSIIFCIDISGSMSSTSEIKSNSKTLSSFTKQEYETLKQFIDQKAQQKYNNKQKSKSIEYISRKQCVLSAIQQQIEKLRQNKPDTVVGLVTFNNEIMIYGDGTQQPIKIGEDQLYDEQEIKIILSRNAKKMMQIPISQSADNLKKNLEKLQENGQTALGPALLSALELAKVGKPGSMIIVCTDGLSNLGLGALDVNSNKKFYESIGQLADEKGISISLVTIKGEGCNLDTVGALVDKTNGIITRVAPEKVGKDFTNIINDAVIATQVELKVQLHKGLKFRGQDQKIQNQNIIKRYIGNITKATTQSFEYQLKKQSELQQERIDLQQLKYVPFQVKIIFTNLKGEKMMRVATKLIQTTQNIEEAEKEVQIDVIHKRMAQKTAELAKQGLYEEAQIYHQNWNQYIQSNQIINSNSINVEKNQKYKKHNDRLSNALKKQEARKSKSQSIQIDPQNIFSKNVNLDQQYSGEQNENQQSKQTSLSNQQLKQNDNQINQLSSPHNTSNEKNKKHNTFQILETDAESNFEGHQETSNSVTKQESNRYEITKDGQKNKILSFDESDEDQDFATIYFYGKAQF